MKAKDLKSLNLYATALLFISIHGLFFIYGCSSSDISSESNTFPSIVSGTTFEKAVEYDAGENPLDITFGDFNDDNKTDIVVTSPRVQEGISTSADGSMTLFLNNSSTTSSFPFTSSTITPESAEWRHDTISADFTGDNITDLVVTQTGEDEIKLLRNDGSANFVDNGSLAVGNVPLKLVSGDWNSDNQTDLAVVNRDNNSVSIIQNNNGIFSVIDTLSLKGNPIQITSADWDGDNYTDLAVLTRSSNLVQIWLNSGSGIFTAQPETYSVGSLPTDMVSGDWNCDENQDLAVSNSGDSTISLIYGNGSGDFDSTVILSSASGPRKIVAADFDNDSIMDFVVAHNFLVSTSGVSLLTGDFSLTLSDNSSSTGYGSPVSFATTISEGGSAPADMAISDVDNDLKLDILITLPFNKKLALLSGKKYYGNLSCP